MVELRKKLDELCVDWHDESEAFDLGMSGFGGLMLRTKWEKQGKEVSVIWGYVDVATHNSSLMTRVGVTYGYPTRLECWWWPGRREPRHMGVKEILTLLMPDEIDCGDLFDEEYE